MCFPFIVQRRSSVEMQENNWEGEGGRCRKEGEDRGTVGRDVMLFQVVMCVGWRVFLLLVYFSHSSVFASELGGMAEMGGAFDKSRIRKGEGRKSSLLIFK